eukprot:Lankesteria_metandrocarpae@DN5285_c1_g1_i2.p1
MLPNATPNQWLRLHQRMKGRRWADFLSDDDSSFSFAQSRSKNFAGASQSTVHASRLGSVQLLQPDMSGSRGVFGSMNESQRRYGVEQPIAPTESKFMTKVSSSDENRFLTNRPKEGGSSHWRTIDGLPHSSNSQGSGDPSGAPQRKFPNGFAGIMTHLSASEDTVKPRVPSKEHNSEGNMPIKNPEAAAHKAGQNNLRLVPAEFASTDVSKPLAGVPRRRLMPLPLTTPMISDSVGMPSSKLTTVIPPMSPQPPVIMPSDSLSVSASSLSSSRLSSAVIVSESRQQSKQSTTANFRSANPSDSDPSDENRANSTASSVLWHTASELPFVSNPACTPFGENGGAPHTLSSAGDQTANAFLAQGITLPPETHAVEYRVDQEKANANVAVSHSVPEVPSHLSGQWPRWHPGYWNAPPPFPMAAHPSMPTPLTAYPHQHIPYPPSQPHFMPPWLPYYYPPYPITSPQQLYMPSPNGGTPYHFPPAQYPWGYSQSAAPHPGMPQCMPMPADAYYAQQQMDQYQAYCQAAQLSSAHANERQNLLTATSHCVAPQPELPNNIVVKEPEDNVLGPHVEGKRTASDVSLAQAPQERLAPLQFRFGSVDIEELEGEETVGGMSSCETINPILSVPVEDVAHSESNKTSSCLPSVTLLPPIIEVPITTRDPSETATSAEVAKGSVDEKFLSVEGIEERKGSGTATNSTAVGAPSTGSFRLHETDDDAPLTASASKHGTKVETFEYGRDKTPSAAFPLVVAEEYFSNELHREQRHSVPTQNKMLRSSSCFPPQNGDAGVHMRQVELHAICSDNGESFPPLVTAEGDAQSGPHKEIRPTKVTAKTASRRKRGVTNNEATESGAVYAFGLTSSTHVERDPKLSSKAKRRQARRVNSNKTQPQKFDIEHMNDVATNSMDVGAYHNEDGSYKGVALAVAHCGVSSSNQQRSGGGLEVVDSTMSTVNKGRCNAVSDVSNSINAKDAFNRCPSGVRNISLNPNPQSVCDPKRRSSDGVAHNSIGFYSKAERRILYSAVSSSVGDPLACDERQHRKVDIRSFAAEMWKQDTSTTTAAVRSAKNRNHSRNSYGDHYNNSRPVVNHLTKLPAFPLPAHALDGRDVQDCVVPPPPCTVPEGLQNPATTCVAYSGGASWKQRTGTKHRLHELSPNKDVRRLRQIEKVMASADYLAYSRAVPRGMRRNSDPSTPLTKGTSHRSFLDEMSIWKVQLKAFTGTQMPSDGSNVP